MLEGAKSIGAGAATIASAGVAVSIGNLLHCCSNDGLFDLIRIPIEKVSVSHLEHQKVVLLPRVELLPSLVWSF
ncbi:ATP synthase subunit 9 [Cucumis melo var. makuwa]|uniref:ATP synthase subunit 9 (Mitochondrion) n=1 Tax=Cucumis melo var. makuwa TaxID=1194695 RepID=A0A5A7SST4_CUCMM|nr:ATP synthase subunit 9 [Cucumis melo var. makuwa]TYK22947.1 ATP synthase subunit 9 [Cucumis melo var. makuwa]